MRFTCNIVEDLLPLYLEDMCSEDSKAALEKHLQECPACREKLSRMRNSEIIPKMKKQESNLPITDYVKKIKRHRIRIGISVALVSAVTVCLLTLCSLTVFDMHRQANPTIFFEEAGVYDLTAEELETTAAEVGEYIFYTNTQHIQVTIPQNVDYESEIILWDATNRDDPTEIGYGHVDSGNKTCSFSSLSAHRRYKVTCDEEEKAALTISDGRIINFWSSLRNVLEEIIGK